MIIHKFTIPIEDFFDLRLPENAQVLTVQTRFNIPQIWVLLDPDLNTFNIRKFTLKGTGHPFDSLNHKYIGSFQLYEGNFLGHLFELV